TLLTSSVNKEVGVSQGSGGNPGVLGIHGCLLSGPLGRACNMLGLFVNPAMLQWIAPTLFGISFRVSSICLAISWGLLGALTWTVFKPGHRCRLCVFSDSHQRNSAVKLWRGGSIGQ